VYTLELFDNIDTSNDGIFDLTLRVGDNTTGLTGEIGFWSKVSSVTLVAVDTLVSKSLFIK
jgi:hypothetical protein